MSYHFLSSSHKHFVFAISHFSEPTSYTQAAKSKDWITAMNTESKACGK